MAPFVVFKGPATGVDGSAILGGIVASTKNKSSDWQEWVSNSLSCGLVGTAGGGFFWYFFESMVWVSGAGAVLVILSMGGIAYSERVRALVSHFSFEIVKRAAGKKDEK